jgi:hypothetical protein
VDLPEALALLNHATERGVVEEAAAVASAASGAEASA